MSNGSVDDQNDLTSPPEWSPTLEELLEELPQIESPPNDNLQEQTPLLSPKTVHTASN